MRMGVLMVKPGTAGGHWVAVDADSGDEAALRAQALEPGWHVGSVQPAVDVPALRVAQPIAEPDVDPEAEDDTPMPVSMLDMLGAPGTGGAMEGNLVSNPAPNASVPMVPTGMNMSGTTAYVPPADVQTTPAKRGRGRPKGSTKVKAPANG